MFLSLSEYLEYYNRQEQFKTSRKIYVRELFAIVVHGSSPWEVCHCGTWQYGRMASGTLRNYYWPYRGVRGVIFFCSRGNILNFFLRIFNIFLPHRLFYNLKKLNVDDLYPDDYIYIYIYIYLSGLYSTVKTKLSNCQLWSL